MAVFNPGDPGLTPAYAQLQNVLAQRGALEATRPNLLDSAGKTVFDTIKDANERMRIQSDKLAEEKRKQNFELEKQKQDNENDIKKVYIQEGLRGEIEKLKIKADATENDRKRSFEARGERIYTPDKVRGMEQELGFDPGALAGMEGMQLKDKDVQEMVQSAAKHAISRIKGEPGKDTPVAKFSGVGDTPATYGDTQQYATTDQRINRQLVNAGQDTTLKNIADQQFPAGGKSMPSPNEIKGQIMLKMIKSGKDSLSPEEAAIVQDETRDPITEQAIKLYSATNPVADKPADAYANVQQMAQQLREDTIQRANSDKLISKLTPKQQARIQQNVDEAVRAINGKETTYENVLSALRASNPETYTLMKKKIDQQITSSKGR